MTLRPRCRGGVMETLETALVLEGAAYGAGELFDALPLSLAACRSSVYDAQSMTAADDDGPVEMLFGQGVGPFGPQREYRFGRAVHGRVRITYTASVPKHDPFARNPGFALARHDRGITGAGLTFLLLPEGEHDYTLTFDLSALDAGAMAIMGCRRGDFAGRFPAEYFKNSYYALGDLREYSREGSRLHIFTLDEDDVFFADLARTAQIYYDYIAKFFRDTSDAYHMILYPTRRTKLTGTALPGVCYLGLGNRNIQSVAEVENTLAHELTHNWCFIEDEELPANLFTEGTAEYYSCYMQYHTGQTDLDGYVEAVNKKLRGCYCHPLARTESYAEIYAKSWTHAFCQKIPYIKGFLMCMQLDALLRRSSGGAQSLDDLTRAAADAVNAGKPLCFADFRTLANDATDGAAQAVFDAAEAPGLPVPDADFFGEDYELVCETVPLGCEGYDPTVRFTDSVIRGLIPGSNAEKAGLRNGDKILQMIADDSDVSIPTQITVQRGGKTLQFTYLAQGGDAPYWQYRKKVRA